MKRHVLILGAGFGGLELATRLSETASDAVDVTLLDRNDSFFFGFSKLEVMLGRQSADDVRLPYRDIAKDGVEFRQETVVGIDPVARRVETDVGTHDADFLVVAMGADYDMAATPGFEEGGHEYYSLAGAERLRDALTDFEGGRVLVSVLGQPFKCPPAPFEGSFLLHEHFTQRGIRDAVQMATTFPMQRPVPVTGPVSQMFRDGLASRGIEELPQHLVTSIDPTAHIAQLATGDTLSLRPVRRNPGAPRARTARGLWPRGQRLGAGRPDQPPDRIPARVRPRRRLHRPTDRPQSRDLRRGGRAGRRRRHRAEISGEDPPAPYEGSGVCYAEFGGGLVSKVEVNFLRGESPAAERHDPSREYAAEKAEFGATRRTRWFGS